ncbi:MAG: mitochondrial fission ELM1 family protein [Alphaproteobacteria bacterium]|jgi:hypothetical protein|nr:mitochondrial fission ELM1 family protein [Alphaproteobacteria bacterium]MDP7222024.1 mitochondrial fission ELM1 family protein [Alphaproteobacteria bacterium]
MQISKTDDKTGENTDRAMNCWIVTEGIIGTENQCIGIAKAMGVPYDIKRIGLKQPWKTLSPHLKCEQSWSFTGDSIVPYQTEQWPDIALCSGRKSIAAARYIRKHSKGKTFVVQIQDPRISPAHFDMVTVPEHDPTRGPNVLVTDAAPNKIDTKMLDDAKEQFESRFALLPTPRIAVMIGGNSKAYTMDENVTHTLCDDLIRLADDGNGIMITASRRTGEDNEKILQERLSHPNIVFWDGTGDNPYLAMLAWADYILVTADSVSMISEAASTGTPVFMIPLYGGAPRISKFHNHMIETGRLKIFEGQVFHYDYTPLDDAKKVAAVILKTMKARNSTAK